MNKIFLLVTTFVLAACAVKQQAPLPNQEMAKKSGTNLETLRRGYVVYHSECSRCHVPMKPKDVSGEDWHIVVPGMAWNAGISQADEEALLKYIMAAR